MSPTPSAPPPIFTLTGNLLAERTLEFAQWAPGRTQRAARESFQVGGKGINVSKMLTRLGVPSTALCFTGGAPGAECEAWLRAQRFTFRAFSAQPATRAGTVVRDASGARPETTFLGPDVAPDAAAIAACAGFLDAQPAGAVLALCGSFPGWASADFTPLRASIARWAGRSFLVADTYGPPLAALVQQPLSLLKINADELRSLDFPDLAALPDHVTRVAVTDGPRLIHARDEHGALCTFSPPIVREVSPTGSGDVFLACVLDALLCRQASLADAIRFAIPHAAANAAHPGVAEFPFPETG